jgi:hypothetical protein
MHAYAATRRDRCASCEIPLSDRPVLRMDEAYCCIGCAQGGPCVCTYEADLAEDGVDGLGLPFAAVEPDRAPAPAPRPERVRASVELVPRRG